MAKDTNEIMGHAHENDGIEEYDNPLPDWWLGLFFFCILFAFGYLINYHFISHNSQVGYYEAEMAAAKGDFPNATGGPTVDSTAAGIEAGAAIFATNCVPCHGADLKGKDGVLGAAAIGPNLTDAEWIHGGEPVQVATTITNGVNAKGMPTWGPVLGPVKIGQVAGYILSKNEAK